MSRRPRDWAPLAAEDPVPGDPDAVHDEAVGMRDTAKALRAQAAELRAIAAAEGLEGRYADTLRAGAGELDHHLRQVAERYERVHAHLASWADELQDLQDESARLLHQAHAATPEPAPASADDPVHVYRVSLHRLTDHRDARAAHYAALLTAACDDVIHDSVWERTEDVVGSVLGTTWVDTTLTWLGYITSAVGLVALCFTPAGWIVTACAVAGFALAAKDVLAAVTGNGSWLDVALDAAGLAGGYAFGRALKAISKLRAATKLAAEAAAAEEAGTRVLLEAEEILESSYNTTGSRTASRAARARARQARGAVRGREDAARGAARSAERARVTPEPTLRERIFAVGEKKAAKDYKDTLDMRARFPHSELVQRTSRHAGSVMGTARGIWLGNTLLGDGSQYLSERSAGYQRLQGRFTLAVGSQW